MPVPVVRRLPILTASLLLLAACGCSVPERLYSPSRAAFGRVLVLPGIEGGTILSGDIAEGLDDGGVRSSIEPYDWTTGLPGGFAINLMYKSRNQRVAQELASEIVAYKQTHPDRPVHLVGHSGGGGIVVFALESLPDDIIVDGALLLGPALSPDYNLAPALRHVRFGLINFYSQRDIGFLKAGTSVFGSMDREFGVSAGATGFAAPANLSVEDRRLYSTRLRQIGWNERMKSYGAPGTHFGWARRGFAQRFLAPIITRNEAAYLKPSAAAANSSRSASNPPASTTTAPARVESQNDR